MISNSNVMNASQPARSTERRVLRYVEAQRLLASGECVVVGASGGADSTALLLLLTRLAPRLGIVVHAAYFDHQLRGKKASNEERDAVTALAGDLGVPLTVGSGDVRAYAREKRLGIEEAARELRYRFLADAAQKVGARTVAVGHTADDQIETILLHILRGSGLTGLAGMLPRSPWPVAAREQTRPHARAPAPRAATRRDGIVLPRDGPPVSGGHHQPLAAIPSQRRP